MGLQFPGGSASHDDPYHTLPGRVAASESSSTCPDTKKSQKPMKKPSRKKSGDDDDDEPVCSEHEPLGGADDDDHDDDNLSNGNGDDGDHIYFIKSIKSGISPTQKLRISTNKKNQGLQVLKSEFVH